MHPRLARYLFECSYRVHGWDYRPALAELEALEQGDPGAVRERRLGKLRDLLGYCWRHVPYQRKVLGNAGLKGGGITSESDLSNLPLMTRRMVREDYERFWSTEPGLSYSTWSTSGTTSEPMPFRLDPAAVSANLLAASVRCRRWHGVEPGVPEVRLWDRYRDLTGSLKRRVRVPLRAIADRLRNQLVVDVRQIDEEGVRRLLPRLLRHRPLVIRGYASALYRLCRFLREAAPTSEALRPGLAIFTAEHLGTGQRELVRETLGCPVVCEYGSNELGLIMFECPEGSVHVLHENFVVEVLVDGRQARPGETGELVVTDLQNRVAPLIRYATGDLVTPTLEVCRCGRTLPIVESLIARTAENFETPGGRVVLGRTMQSVLGQFRAIAQYRITQEHPDHVRVRVVLRKPWDAATRARLTDGLLDAFYRDMSVVIEEVEDIPLGRGPKFRSIVPLGEGEDSGTGPAKHPREHGPGEEQ